MKKQSIIDMLNERNDRSAWDKGVTAYAIDLLDNIDRDEMPENSNLLRKALLNGAQDWNEYSCGGCALCYDGDIADRLCSPSELKRTRGGERNLNGYETWIGVQARALHQAYSRVLSIYKTLRVAYIDVCRITSNNGKERLTICYHADDCTLHARHRDGTLEPCTDCPRPSTLSEARSTCKQLWGGAVWGYKPL